MTFAMVTFVRLAKQSINIFKNYLKMKIITQKYELLPLTRNVKITDTSFYKEFVECKKAHQIILNEMVRIACQIDHYENREFRNAKGNPNFNAMNRLVSKFRTKQEGLDNLPEFLFFKNTKSGLKAKRLHASRYMNEDGENYGYEILNKSYARDLNFVKDICNESWYTKGKSLNYSYREFLHGLGWRKKINKRMPIIPRHICDGKSIAGDTYKLEYNEKEPTKSILRFFGSIKHPMRIVMHRPLMGQAKTMEIVEENGRLYACISVTIDDNHKTELVKLNKNSNKIGLDFGIKDHVVDSNGERYNFPKNQVIDEKVKKLQQILSTKKYGSNNWRKLKNRIATLKARQTRSHDDKIHNFTKQIVNNNDAIAVEDYKSSEIIAKTQSDKTKTNRVKSAINKKSLEGNIHAIKIQLKYKSSLYGKHCALVDPAYTSQDCSSCGHRKSDLELSDRSYTCDNCGTEHDRDINAAKNVLALSDF